MQGLESLQALLLRRVKMLEFALKQERLTKSLASVSLESSAAAAAQYVSITLPASSAVHVFQVARYCHWTAALLAFFFRAHVLDVLLCFCRQQSPPARSEASSPKSPRPLPETFASERPRWGFRYCFVLCFHTASIAAWGRGCVCFYRCLWVTGVLAWLVLAETCSVVVGLRCFHACSRLIVRQYLSQLGFAIPPPPKSPDASAAGRVGADTDAVLSPQVRPRVNFLSPARTSVSLTPESGALLSAVLCLLVV